MNDIWNSIVNFAMTAGIRLLGALILLIVGWIIVKKFVRFLSGDKALKRLDSTVKHFICTVIGISLKALLIITAASILGVPMTSVIALVGTVGLTVGLALQGSLSNIAGSFIIICFRLFKIGDFIESNGQSGIVDDISLFYTTIHTPDNKRIVIPNSIVSNASLTDYSAMEHRRVDLNFALAYDSDIEKVKNILTETAKSHSLVLSDPAPQAYLTELADSALNFQLRVWCKNADYWTVYLDLNETVKKALDKNGMEIPFPQLDVHLDK